MASKRFRELSFWAATGSIQNFQGLVWHDEDEPLVHGEDTRDRDCGAETYVTHTFRGRPQDITRVRMLHPRHEVWVEIPWPSDTFDHDEWGEGL